jgi:hypothetical protein
MTQIFDLSDPAKPVFIRNSASPSSNRIDRPHSGRTARRDFHRPSGNQVYFSCNNKNGVLQIVDRESCRRPGRADH